MGAAAAKFIPEVLGQDMVAALMETCLARIIASPNVQRAMKILNLEPEPDINQPSFRSPRQRVMYYVVSIPNITRYVWRNGLVAVGTRVKKHLRL